MATKQQLQQQLTRCDAEIQSTIKDTLLDTMAQKEDNVRRSTARLHALRLLESQLQAAIKRTATA